jgi:indolepyruvate ferredoxin oxidoreductase, alpha subunit
LSKEFLLGNEAIARELLEAGVDVATGYPGTPSSEILATLAPHAGKMGFHAEWSVNEKVAMEVAAGAAWTGARSVVTTKSTSG